MKKFGCGFKFSLILIAILIIGGFYVWQAVKNFNLQKVLESNFIQTQVSRQIGDKAPELLSVLPKFLGFSRPMTYLILFQNNTEIRPGGGFIGSYAVVKMDKGKTELIAVDGSENLDKNIPADFKMTPPKPLKEFLGVDRWYFRDANWSPDFAVSAQKALDLYIGERGVEAKNIDIVVGMTPTVLEEFLRDLGSLTVSGVDFDADNVTEKLEYEVEYAYDEKGLEFHERKDILKPFMLELLSQLKVYSLINLQDYYDIMHQMIEEKQLVLYSPEVDLQSELNEMGWSGQVEDTNNDFLLWVDANLGALKTDHAIKRDLTYTFDYDKESNRYLARATMNYKHSGSFDWRTSRYRSYVRVFVPLGSELKSVQGSMKNDKSDEPYSVDQGQDLKKTWFGAFISIEPGRDATLVFEYYLPVDLSSKIKNGLYDLLVQKQLGTKEVSLTLDLNFAKNIYTAQPEEDRSDWADNVYSYTTPLYTDREFVVRF